MVLRERLLKRVQRVAVGEALDRLDLAVVGLHAEHEARAGRRAVDEDGARAADAVLAAEVRARVAEVVAQHVGQRAARLDRDLVARAVDREA